MLKTIKKTKGGALPKVKPGHYIISNSIGQLYIEKGGVRKTIGEKGVWSRTRCIVADLNWLYVVDNGYLHRVNPETGEREELKYFRPASLQRSIWLAGGWLYAICAQPQNNLYADINRINMSNPCQCELFAGNVRMDLPSTWSTLDDEVWMIVS